MNPEAMELHRIRSKLVGLSGQKWYRSADDRGQFVEARTEMGELNEIARFHPGALPEEIDFVVGAPEMVAFLLRLVDRAIAKARKDAPRQQKQNKPKDFAAEAAMKCNEPAFKVFLEQQHGLERPLTDDRAAHRLRTLLSITSRSELNSDTAAADRWRSLRAGFEAWRRAG
ncbi:hypothetical protein F9L00_03550 [Brucella anthropi]|uniref:hypothetical protein n=1 Tax=Brucella/Ochrobactrum group TaxID=2826938 RepID=UPI00124E3FCD|nr:MULTISPECIES: hypothetical protein [Brucella/Ochrobactrum group]KAB2764775.1 hypothetical protein F9K98_01115 [Brucella anthropi]KAB2782554.1 hypothetical protein F9L00_03550 [Brucella anthropi]MCQ9143319.1 hypothetical protein [Ochrobactrum sp. BTU2]UGQ23854.1 hypothetical protein LRL11_16490 [Brucella anthropi]